MSSWWPDPRRAQIELRRRVGRLLSTRSMFTSALKVHYAALVNVDTETLALAIGSRVRQERQSRTWTLDDLADASGISRRMVVNVEQGSVNPSVGTLLRLSGALGIGLPTLVEPAETTPVKITRSGKGSVLWTGESGGSGILVAATQPPDVVELWDWTITPGETHASEPHAPGTRELIHVRSGTLKFDVPDNSTTLTPGDAISYPGDQLHTFTNPGNEPARFTMTVFEPHIGPRRQARSHNG